MSEVLHWFAVTRLSGLNLVLFTLMLIMASGVIVSPRLKCSRRALYNLAVIFVFFCYYTAIRQAALLFPNPTGPEISKIMGNDFIIAGILAISTLRLIYVYFKILIRIELTRIRRVKSAAIPPRGGGKYIEQPHN